MLTKIKEVKAKTIITKTNLPGCDYVVNPYNGCQFACMYCYAAQIARWKHPGEEWGSFLDVKINAPELLKNELAKLEKKSSPKISVSFGLAQSPIPTPASKPNINSPESVLKFSSTLIIRAKWPSKQNLH